MAISHPRRSDVRLRSGRLDVCFHLGLSPEKRRLLEAGRTPQSSDDTWTVWPMPPSPLVISHYQPLTADPTRGLAALGSWTALIGCVCACVCASVVIDTGRRTETPSG